jgi:hypothetical protein
MIIKIDHIAYASKNLDEAIGVFKKIGYEIGFIEKNLRDLNNKRHFMAHFSGDLEMAFMNRQGSIGIELINHGHTVEKESYFFPVFEGLSMNTGSALDSFVFEGNSFNKTESYSLKAHLFILEDAGSSRFRCNKVIAEVADIEKSAEFWAYLGFKMIKVREDVAKMEFKTPIIGDAYHLYLRKNKSGPASCYLDSHGFNCIAFICSNANKELRKFEIRGIESSDINLFRVNGKDLKIFWIKGPCGEIVEIIGLA